jgi:hypothetical protein
MSVPNTNYTSGNYSNSDLINVFPVTKFYPVYVTTGSDGTKSGTVSITNGYNTNYAVFSSIYYGFTGSSGVYNAADTSSAMNQIVINNITTASFDWVFKHSTGDNLNIYIVFMVVYNDTELTYPKSYS